MSVVTPPPSAERRKPIGPSFSKSRAKCAATYARFRVVATELLRNRDNRTKTPIGSDILRRKGPAASPFRRTESHETTQDSARHLLDRGPRGARAGPTSDHPGALAAGRAAPPRPAGRDPGPDRDDGGHLRRAAGVPDRRRGGAAGRAPAGREPGAQGLAGPRPG